MKTLMLLMSMVLIGLASAAPHYGEAVLKNVISKLAEKIEEAKKQQITEQMEEAMDEQYPDYAVEEAEEQDDNDKAIALMKFIGQLREDKKLAKVDEDDQMEEAMDEQYPDYGVEKAEEQEDNKETDQSDKAIALMKFIGQLREAKELAEEESCTCFESPCPTNICLDPWLSSFCNPISCTV
ncbi:uncharacterized protein LOC135345298 [Halichondria panicea]|uniref:uncharacterized protein LOC135345298 n=1 Tax=Halichondria panicea TaxID=6063 RepID=UPI00312BC945